jgi:hypothetical protein
MLCATEGDGKVKSALGHRPPGTVPPEDGLAVPQGILDNESAMLF